MKNEVVNINHLWASAFVENLRRSGVKRFFIAPGSRNTPLVSAVLSDERLSSYVHFDERGCGFRALGHAKSTDEAVAVIVTSGTALANVYPAMLEAYYSHLRFLVISGDRSHEELYNNNNQSMDQHHVYSASLVEYFHIPAPSEHSSFPHLLRLSGEVALRLSRPSVLHVNMSFRKPFDPHVPTNIPASLKDSYEQFMKSGVSQTPITANVEKQTVVDFGNMSLSEDGVLFVLAEMSPNKAKTLALKLSKAGMTFYSESHTSVNSQFQLQHLSLYAKQLKTQKISVVVLGGKVVSSEVQAFINTHEAYSVHPHGLYDPFSTVRQSYRMEEEVFLEQFLSEKKPKSFKSDEKTLTAELTKQLANQWSELTVIRESFQLLPSGSMAFVANSLPIRQYIHYVEKSGDVEVFSNRGLSGIDGNVATFVGLGEAKKYAKHLLVIGDTSLLHDLNSLHLCSRLSNVVILLINNGGGGIFKYLPIYGGDKKTFEGGFFNAHGVDSFEQSARQFGLEYHRVEGSKQWAEVVLFLKGSGEMNRLIEVCIDSEETLLLEKSLGGLLNS